MRQIRLRKQLSARSQLKTIRQLVFCEEWSPSTQFGMCKRLVVSSHLSFSKQFWEND
jgi:hypothetical protein